MLFSGLKTKRAIPLVALCVLCFSVNELTAAEKTANDKTISGKEIFAREWLPDDPRSHGGDGLGPVFNDSSCVACHNQGGVGGAGPASKNVDIVSVVSHIQRTRQTSASSQIVRSLFGLDTGDIKADIEAVKRESRRLAKVHPGFLTARSVVLHRFGLQSNYADWRQKLSGAGSFPGFGRGVNMSTLAVDTAIVPKEQRIDPKFKQIQNANREMLRVRGELGVNVFSRTSFQQGATIIVSQRNPIALFGGGLIDSISDEALETQAEQKFKGFPNISGRVARLRDGRIGRFGWKAQKATLYDFTMTACAVELGLHVPDHPQSGVPTKPQYKATGFDLNQDECDALVNYLKALPAPVEKSTTDGVAAEYLSKGKHLFVESGCSNCHVEKMDQVAGIYSDLLVHDMGQDLGDTGDYGVFIPDSPGDEEFQSQQVDEPLAKGETKKKKGPLGANRLEWRTAPLWGLRDSGPYMHDGRAKTIEQAIAFHGGEGVASANRYFMLSLAERHQVLGFLKSLTAPNAKQVASIDK